MPAQPITVWRKIGRLIKHKLIVPLIRSNRPPEFKAHGVAVGLAWAMTPLVGIQMWLVFMTWVGTKRLFKWDFSLPLALAWTWVSNVFTLVPIYYVFYVTGQIMQGEWGNISGYDTLTTIIRDTFFADYSFGEKWALFFKLFLKDWGVAMAIGCLPWMAGAYIVGYYFTMRFEKMREIQRAKKQLTRGKNEASF